MDAEERKLMLRILLTLAAILLWATVASAQTVSCTGPTGQNCVPVVTIPSSLSATAGSGNAGYPVGSTPITAIFSGADTTSSAATLAAAAAKFTYICGFQIGGLGATAATIVNPTVGTVIGGNTFTFASAYTFASGAAVASTPFTYTFSPCVPGSAVNTAVVVTVPGAAGNTSTAINAWGYQQ